MHSTSKQISTTLDEELSIKVTIGNRVYPLTIYRSQEEMIRKSAEMVNKNIKELEQNYAVRDRQDLLAMSALFFANKSMEAGGDANQEKSELEQGLEALNEQLGQYLDQKA